MWDMFKMDPTGMQGGFAGMQGLGGVGAPGGGVGNPAWPLMSTQDSQEWTAAEPGESSVLERSAGRAEANPELSLFASQGLGLGD